MTCDDSHAADLRLSWNRDDEGVITVYATDPDAGRIVAVADFWTGPLRQHMGIPEPRAQALQQQLAETLVENWNGPWRDTPGYRAGVEAAAARYRACAEELVKEPHHAD